MPTLISRIARAFFRGVAAESFPIAALRATRSLRAYTLGDSIAEVFDNPCYVAHRRAVADHDEVFFLSHRNFLVHGLTVRERAMAARHHYAHELVSFDRSYFDAVYGSGGGLVLWSDRAGDDIFEIVLQPGCDVLYEGGCSLVMRQNGQRTCVISYSYVPPGLFCPEVPSEQMPASPSVILVTRRHATVDHSYQKAFNQAFDRATVGHMCFAALTGVATAQGFDFVIGMAAAHHPSRTAANSRHLDAAYDEFWSSLNGTVPSKFGFRVQVPMQLSPLAEMNARHRKRASARRSHLHAVHESARRILANRRVDSGSAALEQRAGFPGASAPASEAPAAGTHREDPATGSRRSCVVELPPPAGPLTTRGDTARSVS